MNTLFRKIGLKLAYEWLGAQGRAAADGRLGPGVQRAYLAMRGDKRVVGFILALLAQGLEGAGQYDWAAGVAILAAGLLAAGLVDNAWRTTVPTSVTEWKAYQFARAHSANITAGLAAASAAVATCSVDLSALLVRLHMTCSTAGTVLAGTSAACGLLGITADAKLAEPPRLDNPIPPAPAKLAGMPTADTKN